MAHIVFNLFHAKKPQGRRVPVTVSVDQYILEEARDGEPVWLLKVETNMFDALGQVISPEYIYAVSGTYPIDDITKAAARIAEQIDWGALEEDTYPPRITAVSPARGEENVSIFSNVMLDIKDPFPTSTLDPSTIKLKVNGVDVSSQLHTSGKHNEYRVVWSPIRILD